MKHISQKKSANQEISLLSLQNLCTALSISIETGKNWIKLGKLIPSQIINGKPVFTLQYLNSLKTQIDHTSHHALKQRRNKQHISGSNLYDAYLSGSSPNISVIQELLSLIQTNQIQVTNELILLLAADCAIQLFRQQNGEKSVKCSLKQYLLKQISLDGYEFLVDALCPDIESSFTIIDQYPALFYVEYTYEQNEDILGLLYLSLNNIGKRKSTGSYYTPEKIIKKLCVNLFTYQPMENKTILDPCCGTGNFLLHLPDEIPAENIYGNDIDPISIMLARINLALKFRIKDKEFFNTHLTIQNYLDDSFKRKFHYIIGNPPWGYVYTEEEKKVLRKKYRSADGKHIESYAVFMEKSFSCLHPEGIVSFILPETILNVKTHQRIREFLLSNSTFQYLEFLGNPFDQVQCPSIILQAEKTGNPKNEEGLIVNDGKRIYQINEKRKISSEYFSFLTTDEEYLLLSKIGNMSNQITLKDNAAFALGIVTGNNTEYVLHEKKQDSEMILKGSDLCKFHYHDSKNYLIFQPERFQQSASEEYYRAEEKLLYRFICRQLVFAYDNRQILSLNSCNILIPQIETLNIKYILAVLNSRTAQFFFNKTFNSVKVLRSHIEQIPIPFITEEEQQPVISLTEELIHSSPNTQELYDKLDLMIANLYHLSSQEYELIKSSMKSENLFLD